MKRSFFKYWSFVQLFIGVLFLLWFVVLWFMGLFEWGHIVVLAINLLAFALFYALGDARDRIKKIEEMLKVKKEDD